MSVWFEVSTEFVSKYPLWTGGRAAGQPFVIRGTIHYPEETILYPLNSFKKM
jgi:hypothetical protein